VKDDATMMDVIATILGRLVNVALFIVFSILALLFLRANTDLHMGLVAVLSIVIGITATVLVRLLLNALRSLGERLRS
jgi:phosphate starvation-inducible membrane PsiE